MNFTHPQYALCLRCYNVFSPAAVDMDATYNVCPLQKCQGELVSIDENMLPIITILNKKNYFTLNCCSGHLWDDDMYIHFAGMVEVPTENLPAAFCLENYEEIVGGPIIRRKKVYSPEELEHMDYLKIQSRLFKDLNALLKWAESLEEVTINV